MNIYKQITEKIIDTLSKGIIPWRKPWSTNLVSNNLSMCVSHMTGKPYSLLNQMLLLASEEDINSSFIHEYLTFNQIKAEGGRVKKGEKSKFIVFWSIIDKKTMSVTDDNSLLIEEKNKKFPILRYFNVFEVSQCEGIERKYSSMTAADSKLSEESKVDAAEEIIKNYIEREKLKIYRDEETDMAYYSPSEDFVSVPCLTQYSNIEEYYSTVFHELVHSTGHSSRLNRFSNDEFDSDSYSKEELVAEIGAAFLSGIAGLNDDSTFINSAAYIQNWIKALQNDNKLIVTASSKAEAAAKYIINQKQ